MHLVNKIFLGLTLLIAPAYFYFAIGVLEKQNEFRKQYLESGKATLAEQEKQRRVTHGPTGIYRTRSELEQLMAGRGRIWVQANRAAVTPAGNVNLQIAPMFVLAAMGDESLAGGAAAAITGPIPQQVEIFEQVQPITLATNDTDATSGTDPAVAGPAGSEAKGEYQQARIGRYLGQFSVTGNGNSWSLTPTRELAPSILASLQGSRANWLVYEKMPKVRPNILERGNGGTPVARFRGGENMPTMDLRIVDYEARLHTINDSLVELAYQQNRLKFNIGQTDNATLLATDATTKLTVGNTQFAKDLEQMESVSKTIVACATKLRNRIEETNDRIADIHGKNRNMVVQLAGIQQQILRQLNAGNYALAATQW